ncbi:GNAT family protein [Streptomyces sp. W16]|uniref:GNAT family N-acetyltransferase n=1 Tax=Streptomyces sp. W16 TaxID=3076631 RepID=UPI00295B94A8|nr:GNAT family protein [Streptomyces sp. W16]MDV9176783.1 GNAT family protein [Streptomyces sp. W16]
MSRSHLQHASEPAWDEMAWPVPEGTELRGKHVRLTSVDPAAHAEGLFAALDHSQVWQHFGTPRPSDAAQLAAGLAHFGQSPDLRQWAVVAVRPVGGFTAGDVIGVSSYLDASPHNARVEIGATAYSPSVWSTAVNPETKLLLLRYAFETLNCARVQFRTDVRNERSRRAILGIGAVHEGTLLRYERRIDGTIRDTALYSIPADRWPDVAKHLTHRVEALE